MSKTIQTNMMKIKLYKFLRVFVVIVSISTVIFVYSKVYKNIKVYTSHFGCIFNDFWVPYGDKYVKYDFHRDVAADKLKNAISGMFNLKKNIGYTFINSLIRKGFIILLGMRKIAFILPNIIFMCIIGLFVFLIAKKLNGFYAGIYSLLLLFTFPSTVFVFSRIHSRLIASCFVIVGIYFFLNSKFMDKLSSALLSSFFLGLALWSHHFAIGVFLLLDFYLLLLSFFKKRKIDISFVIVFFIFTQFLLVTGIIRDLYVWAIISIMVVFVFCNRLYRVEKRVKNYIFFKIFQSFFISKTPLLNFFNNKDISDSIAADFISRVKNTLSIFNLLQPNILYFVFILLFILLVYKNKFFLQLKNKNAIFLFVFIVFVCLTANLVLYSYFLLHQLYFLYPLIAILFAYLIFLLKPRYRKIILLIVSAHVAIMLFVISKYQSVAPENGVTKIFKNIPILSSYYKWDKKNYLVYDKKCREIVKNRNVSEFIEKFAETISENVSKQKIYVFADSFFENDEPYEFNWFALNVIPIMKSAMNRKNKEVIFITYKDFQRRKNISDLFDTKGKLNLDYIIYAKGYLERQQNRMLGNYAFKTNGKYVKALTFDLNSPDIGVHEPFLEDIKYKIFIYRRAS